MANRFHPGRIAAAVLGASIALMSAAPLAFAADSAAPHDGTSSVTATPIDPNPGPHGVRVLLKGGDLKEPSVEGTTLIALKIDGVKDPVLTYCIGLTLHLNHDKMHEVDWDKYPNPSVLFDKNKSQINWVLHNSFPTVKLADLAKAAGIPDLTVEEAVGATQSAVWHFSDGVDLVGAKNSDGKPYSDKTVKDVDKLYHFLTDKNPGLEQPKPTLNIASADAKQNGNLVGPFVIKSTATGDLKLDTSKFPKGVTLTDAKGNPVTSVKDGDSVFVKVADGTPAGNTTFSISAEATLDLGRIFVGVNDNPDKCKDGSKDQKYCTQPLIVAQASKVTVSAEAPASWTTPTTPTTTTTTTTTTTKPTTTTTTTQPCVPSTSTSPTTTTTTTTSNGGTTSPTTTSMPPSCTTPTPTTTADTNQLAYTGASVIGPVIAAIVLIGAGIGALFFVRRRKANHS
ncbi:thioester domain-containing protein [Kutzneria sp. NPDC051319]|uniref:thioester domain-containing protein n=1 Tax=Kutzneria sp. NPDC051319 TaxID=3155047 RepID=UPI00342E4DED